MVRFYLLVLCTVAAGCSGPEYTQPIRLEPHGTAVRANMNAHIINPVPTRRDALAADASRPVLATRSYRENDVEAAAPEDGQTLTGAGE